MDWIGLDLPTHRQRSSASYRMDGYGANEARVLSEEGTYAILYIPEIPSLVGRQVTVLQINSDDEES